MAKEIKVSQDRKTITIYNEGPDGSLYETTVHLGDKQPTQDGDKNKQEGE